MTLWKPERSKLKASASRFNDQVYAGTNIVIYVIKRRSLHVLDTFYQFAVELSISTITYSELLHDVEKSQRRAHNYTQVQDLVSRLEVLDYGEKAAAHYGDIRADLERKGTPICGNDLHIAAHARCEGLVLVANNLREFERVEGLRVENWV